MTTYTDLQKLLYKLDAARANEATYKAERIALENAVAAHVGVKVQGQKTVIEGDFRVVVKPNYGYSIDMARWNEVAKGIPAEMHPFKLVLDETRLKAIRREYPDTYTDIAFAVTVTPGKPSVTVTKATA